MSYPSLLSAFHWKPCTQKDSPEGLLRELRAVKRSKELKEGEGPGPALGLRGRRPELPTGLGSQEGEGNLSACSPAPAAWEPRATRAREGAENRAGGG